MKKRVGNNGNHGAPGRSGRKPNAITLAKRAIVANKLETAEAAFAFQEAILFDDTQTLTARSVASMWLYEQVMGKPLQRTAEGGAEAYKEHMEKWVNAIRGTADNGRTNTGATTGSEAGATGGGGVRPVTGTATGASGA